MIFNIRTQTQSYMGTTNTPTLIGANFPALSPKLNEKRQLKLEVVEKWYIVSPEMNWLVYLLTGNQEFLLWKFYDRIEGVA